MKLFRFLVLCLCVFSSSLFADTPCKNCTIDGTSQIRSGTLAIKSGAVVTLESGATLNLSAGTLTLADGQIPWPKVSKTVQDLAFSSASISALNVDWSASQTFSKTLAANSTFTFSNTKDGQTIKVRLTNTTDDWTVTWPAAVLWPGNTAPTQTTGAKTDLYTFVRIGADLYGSAEQDYNPPTASPTPTPSATPTPTPTPSPTPTPTATPLVYVSDGDTNGVFHFLGTDHATTSWSNPHTANRCTIGAFNSSDAPNLQAGTLAGPVNLDDTDDNQTGNTAGTYWRVDFGAGNSLAVDTYSFIARPCGSGDASNVAQWKLQGSNNASSWTDLDSQTGVTYSIDCEWKTYPVTGAASYRYLRILHQANVTGANQFLFISEWEFYGVFTYVP